MTDDDRMTKVDIRAELEANRRRGREIDERMKRHDDEHRAINRRIDLLRQSIAASVDGGHERAGELLDELDALDAEERSR